jgi:hypothetical protein
MDYNARLYGCLGCGRAHMCRPPHDMCPRVTASDGATVRCWFSGRVVGTDHGVVIARGGGTFDLDCQARDSPRGNWAGGGGPTEAKPKFLARNARRVGEMRRAANYTGDQRQRARQRRTADHLASLQQANTLLDKYARRSGELLRPATASSALTSQDEEAEDAPAAPEAPDSGMDGPGHDRYDDTDTHMDNPGEDQEGGDGPWTYATLVDVAVPRATTELVYDDAYLETFLEPVLARIGRMPAAAAAAAASSTAARGTKRPRLHGSAEPAPAADPWAIAPLMTDPAGPAAAVATTAATATARLALKPLPWMPLYARADPEDSTTWLPHQVVLGQTVGALVPRLDAQLRASAAAKGGEVPRPQPVWVYVQWADAVLTLVQAYSPTPAAAVHGPEHNLRSLGTLLVTELLPATPYVPDAATGLQLPLWVLDPWLMACRAAGLVHDRLSQQMKQFLVVLKGLPFSPVVVRALIHGTAYRHEDHE